MRLAEFERLHDNSEGTLLHYYVLIRIAIYFTPFHIPYIQLQVLTIKGVPGQVTLMAWITRHNYQDV